MVLNIIFIFLINFHVIQQVLPVSVSARALTKVLRDESLPSMSVRMLSKKRKVDAECRIFQERWKYFFWEVGGKPVCLICSQQVAVSKEYNIRRHYETHQEKYNEYTGQRRTQKLNELASSLQKQQNSKSSSFLEMPRDIQRFVLIIYLLKVLFLR